MTYLILIHHSPPTPEIPGHQSMLNRIVAGDVWYWDYATCGNVWTPDAGRDINA